jgi:broad specificity phosphatase PhoE
MIGGNTDWPLTELGKKQAHNIGRNLKNVIENGNNIIYSSDQLRTKQTAEIVNEYFNLEIIYKPELREINVGEAKGKTREWHKENCAPRENIPPAHYRPFPSAETLEEVYIRVGPIINEIINIEYDTVLVVGHGLSLIMFLLQWLKIPVESMEHIAFEASAGGVSFLSMWENRRMLKKYNITSYME